MAEALAIYEKNLSTDRAGFNRRVASAVQKMKDNHILTRLSGQEDRHEVSPALKLRLSADDVSQLSATRPSHGYLQAHSRPVQRRPAGPAPAAVPHAPPAGAQLGHLQRPDRGTDRRARLPVRRPLRLGQVDPARCHVRAADAAGHRRRHRRRA
ncbi:hypothetical protein G6F68_013404 [Rhizopus microsporus]|nr:hypothetical protein G6F68_013404 [Rhizopus microsporus]